MHEIGNMDRGVLPLLKSVFAILVFVCGGYIFSTLTVVWIVPTFVEYPLTAWWASNLSGLAVNFAAAINMPLLYIFRWVGIPGRADR